MLTGYTTFTTSNLFAFSHEGAYPVNGWSVYNIRKEFQRLGIPSAEWRISTINEKYDLCPTYPNLLCVPSSASDELITTAAQFRSKCRLPSLTWIHPKNKASLTRCSQPMVGVARNKSPDDVLLLKKILEATPSASTLHIVDARPRAAAVANQARGAGYEDVASYDNCVILFLGIANIHSMRDSFNKLRDLCLTVDPREHKFWSVLDSTGWMNYIRLILAGSEKIVQIMNNGQSIVSHCSDGWDRTSQLVSISQVMMDPYYRTLEGIQVLIEKDWLSFGHKFALRYGHGLGSVIGAASLVNGEQDENIDKETETSLKESERSPVFLQFIECLWQISRQYPALFEFNEDFLILVLDALFSCRFGTFLCNNDLERVLYRVKNGTISLWSYVNANRQRYTNALYKLYKNSKETNQRPQSDWCPIMNVSEANRLEFWSGYYMRFRPELLLDDHDDIRSVAVSQLTKKEEEIAALVEELSRLENDKKQQRLTRQTSWKLGTKDTLPK
eukprot:TRINITY_DN4331_c0_g2_i1.p1 TRINITY_DN4331_c0_g2~~TRINITY_DN4331_c0_g2_i1.p1  ORF type:complete len:502 (-),score=86.43 TRINITY_DN4331_c0_g2_i1:34-1539(-)